MSATARLFFALDLPKQALDTLVEIQQALRPFADRFELRWCRREQMHLTVKFLGDIRRDDIQPLSQILDTAKKSFGASFEHVTTFPDARRARVLVVEVKPDDERLAELARALDEHAAGFGVERERRAFRPHLTLARFKKPGNATFLLESAQIQPLAFRFDLLRLYESTRSEYLPLASVRLAAE